MRPGGSTLGFSRQRRRRQRWRALPATRNVTGCRGRCTWTGTASIALTAKPRGARRWRAKSRGRSLAGPWRSWRGRGSWQAVRRPRGGWRGATARCRSGGWRAWNEGGGVGEWVFGGGVSGGVQRPLHGQAGGIGGPTSPSAGGREAGAGAGHPGGAASAERLDSALEESLVPTGAAASILGLGWPAGNGGWAGGRGESGGFSRGGVGVGGGGGGAPEGRARRR